jgi:riboflavin kinase/FMN adenylyltransferase
MSDAELATRPCSLVPGLLRGRTVVISGAGSGIGRASAWVAARLGARVVLCGRSAEKLARVRSALAAGDMAQAARLLGRAYSMRARVARGAGLGRTLGFPTANLPVQRRRVALSGIFAVRVRGDALRGADRGRGGWPAVASLGTRPMVNGAEPLLEVHLFDYQGELYGAELEVEFVARLRDEQRFESLEAMVAQMHRDAEAARTALAPLV